jgi:hypothetical protein
MRFGSIPLLEAKTFTDSEYCVPKSYRLRTNGLKSASFAQETAADLISIAGV